MSECVEHITRHHFKVSVLWRLSYTGLRITLSHRFHLLFFFCGNNHLYFYKLRKLDGHKNKKVKTKQNKLSHTRVRPSLALSIIAKLPSFPLNSPRPTPNLLRILFRLQNEPHSPKSHVTVRRRLHVLRRREWLCRRRSQRIRRSGMCALQEIRSFTVVLLLFLFAQIRSGAVERLRKTTESGDCFN